jgi:hypothetical protein
MIIIQFNSCLFMCKLNSTVANYKVSTNTQKIKEQNTKYDSLYNTNKLVKIPVAIIII